ncbi:uncharacterized protein CLUP02_04158 [Colletotrichum lupini]|uniref:Uncharacterized protein n=1 Tax=Colletotrichum lupini TaxID=145971 RepID=A0A9Q8WD15_9PEZI|nr:uncharacterized protein CLUP02_04158 [Colletotrichum lupini]UQC78681.1 hypothetical protein CLUP02_04158 [Colletotrichum lupini]
MVFQEAGRQGLHGMARHGLDEDPKMQQAGSEEGGEHRIHGHGQPARSARSARKFIYSTHPTLDVMRAICFHEADAACVLVWV